MNNGKLLRLLLAAAALPATPMPVAPAGLGVPLPEAAEAQSIRLQAAPVTPELGARMRRWHRTYRRGFAPVLELWTTVERAARRRPSESLLAGCRRLGRALGRLDRRPLLAAPDGAVVVHLERTLRHLEDAARSCTHGAYFLTTWRLERAAGSWSELGQRLHIYGLTP